MEPIVTGQEMQAYDRFTITNIGLPSLVLMERAALAAQQALDDRLFNLTRVLVVCGSGNNGGDGFALARLLHISGINVTVLFCGNADKCTTETRQQWDIANRLAVAICQQTDISQYTCIVDALFGIGLSRPIGGELASVIEQINQSSAHVLALDIASGINASNGQIMGIAVKADKTVCFAWKKRGCVLFPGADYTGIVSVADIGISAQALIAHPPQSYSFTESDLMMLPARRAYSNKGSYGKALIIAGSENMSGAAYFSAKAAYCCGCGLVRLYSPQANRTILQSQLPEALFTAYDPKQLDHTQIQQQIDWATVIVIGPGLGQSIAARQILHHVMMHAKVPLIIDADAINILAEHPDLLTQSTGSLIITPHLGEMARLTGQTITYLRDNLISCADQLAREHRLICVLKDSRTVISQGDGNIYINQSGCHAMAKGGSGDILTGMIAAMIAQKLPALEATALAVYLHGLAGQQAAKVKSSYSVLASDIIDVISMVLKEYPNNKAVIG